MAESSNKTTIHSVAKAAGVSIATVSRVLNGKDRVAPETQKKVLAAVERLNFYPNSRAKAFSSQRNDMIGLVVPDFKGQYFTTLMEGAFEEAKEHNVNIMVLKAKGSQEKIKTLQNIRREGRTDGIILMLEELHDKVLENIGKEKKPIVILDKNVNYRKLDNILVDNKTAAFEATSHMIQIHKPEYLFFVGGPENNLDTIARSQGFKDAIQYAQQDIKDNIFFAGQYEYDLAYTLTKDKLLPLLSENVQAGIIAANDDLACGVIDALESSQVRVPGDVGVIGFDDSMIAIRRRLKLTTMRTPVNEIGKSAVRMLMNRLNNKQSEPSQLILKSKLIIRNSCGCMI